MTNASRIQLGPDSGGFEKGRNPHGRWRTGYHRAAAPETNAPVPAALLLRNDADRLAFAMTSGPAAVFLAEEIAEYLWTRESLNEEWPVNLREWLQDDTNQWTGTPRDAGRTGFICGRLERNLPGGRIYLAWLGMSGARLQDRSGNDITLDTVIGEGEGWTPENGPEPEGLALHAYRGSLFGLERMSILSPGADVLNDDLPDISSADLETALADWADESEHDLAVFDLRLNPVLTAPTRVVVNHRWISPELCLLFWQPSPNATAYRITESETPDFAEETMIAEMTDGRQTQYKLSPPTSGACYYRVTPLNQGVPGTPSEPIRPTPIVLSAPILQPVEWDRDGGYVLRWSPVEQATGYEVQTAPSMDFDPYESEIIYRGEIAEMNLSPTIAPHQVYRVRAINVLYAPQHPSSWSMPRRAPAQLETPHFTKVTHERIEWEHIPGAQQYAVRVTAAGEDEDQGDDVFTREPSVHAADLPATYRVRAFRHPSDHRTASEWSASVMVAPKESALSASAGSSRMAIPLLITAAIVALVVGVALGVSGIEAYRQANATSTRTPLPEAAVAGTRDAATAAVVNATQVQMLGTRVRATEFAIQVATGTASAWTDTPTPTETLFPTETPNMTSTVRVALTQAAIAWTETPSPTSTDTPTVTPSPAATLTPTATLSPTVTPDIDATVAVVLTQDAESWTVTPTPYAVVTLNMTETIAAVFTEAAASWTVTPTASQTPRPTATPNMTATIAAALTDAAEDWTATPVPTSTSTPPPADIEATIAAYVEYGCYIFSVPVEGLAVHARANDQSPVVLEHVPVLAQVTKHLGVTSSTGNTRAEWIQVRVLTETDTLAGWVRIPDDTDPARIYGGPQCP